MMDCHVATIIVNVLGRGVRGWLETLLGPGGTGRGARRPRKQREERGDGTPGSDARTRNDIGRKVVVVMDPADSNEECEADWRKDSDELSQQSRHARQPRRAEVELAIEEEAQEEHASKATRGMARWK